MKATRTRLGAACALGVGICLAAFGAGAAPALNVVVGKHGETHASLALQNDVNNLMHTAVPMLVQNAGGPAAIACGKMTRIDTVVTKFAVNAPWSETWTYIVCNTKIAIPIDFAPTPDGGADFTLRQKDILIGPAGKH